MPVINTQQSYSLMLLTSVAEKMTFGTTTPELSPNGERKYTIEVAVSEIPPAGMRVTSSILAITLTGGDHNQIMSLTPGTPVSFESLRCGVSSPEQRQDGKGIRGGKLFYSGTGLRVARVPEKAS